MSALSSRRAEETRKFDRTHVRQDEQLFGSVLSDIAKTLWPTGTAAGLAAKAGCSVRAAEFYLAGDRDWSGDALTAIVSEILKRHSMRNVRIGKRP